MKRSVEEIKKALQGLGADWLESFDELIAGAGDSYAEELSKKNREALNLRTRLKDTEAKLASAQKTAKRLLDHVGIDDEPEDLEEALATLKTAQGGGKGTDSETARKIERLEKMLRTQKEDAERQVGAERSKRQEILAQNAVITALVAGKAQKPEVLALALKGNVKVLDDDSVVYEDGDKQMPIADGIGAFLKANPEFVLSGGKGGSGSGKPGGTGEAETEVAAAKSVAEERNKAAAAPMPVGFVDPWANKA